MSSEFVSGDPIAEGSEWVGGYVLSFSDGGPGETVVLAQGDEAFVTEAVAKLGDVEGHAVIYTGTRSCVGFLTFVAPASSLDP